MIKKIDYNEFRDIKDIYHIGQELMLIYATVGFESLTGPIRYIVSIEDNTGRRDKFML